MITAWTEHLKDPEEKTRFEASLRHSKWVFDRLKDILSKIDNSLTKQEISPRIYDNPNWEYRQAHLNGYRQCLNDVNTLITLDLKEHIGNDRQPTE